MNDIIETPPRQMRLKRKYLRGIKTTYKGGENAAPKKKRVKIGFQKHIDRFGVPPEMVLRVNARGKSHMERMA